MEAAIIGVIGTLLGTVLGWFLNVLSNRGKVSVYLSSWTDSFRHKDNEGFMTDSTSESQAEYFEFECSLDIYNSSSYTKIMRDVKIVFCDGRKVLFSDIPNDQKVRKTGSYGTVMPQNIPPHTVVNIQLSSCLSIKDNNLFEIFRTNNIYLEYSKEKNKVRRVSLKKVDYRNHFENQANLSE